MPEDLKLSQIGSSQMLPPFRGLHSPGVRKHCQIIFACYFCYLPVISGNRLLRLNGLNAELSPEWYWQGPGSHVMYG